jgi:hypothetical protein
MWLPSALKFPITPFLGTYWTALVREGDYSATWIFRLADHCKFREENRVWRF